MKMDSRLSRFSGSMNGVPLGNQFPLGNQSPTVFPNRTLFGGSRIENPFLHQNLGGGEFPLNGPLSVDAVPSSTMTSEEDPQEDCDFSDSILRYINQMLMEEDMEDKTCMLQESLDLQAAEKSFYEVIGQKYPPSPEQSPTFLDQNSECPDDYLSRNHSNCIGRIGNGSDYVIDPSWFNNLVDYSTSQAKSLPLYNTSQSSVSTSNSFNNFIDGFLDSPNSPLQVADLYSGSQSIWQFRKGVEEASKFLPSNKELLINFEVNGLSNQELKRETSEVFVKVERKEEKEYSPVGSKGKKNPHRDDEDMEEERISKQAAIFPESTVRSNLFDTVLLCSMGEGKKVLSAYREVLKNRTSKKLEQNGQSKESNGRKGRSKKQKGKREVVDLRTLLINCAQAIAADDRRSANELLKRIRQYSSAFGEGNQRLALYFANGLEARLAGTGSQIYKGFVCKKTSAADYLKAYHLSLASCPFRRISNFVANKTIMIKAENAMRLHIIDFGILYGFQWPTFIQRISDREGGPPKIRITGIEFPQPGFRPAAGVEETGRRLADYARSFNVPFEYNAIAKKWDSIKLEDLKIDKDEFLVVNCLYRAKNLHDETVLVDSSRSIVLNLIRKVNPDIFIHGIVNGAYNAPFFVTRFREAMFHFSALFDMLETNVPRDHDERILIEREIFGKEALNVIACEGWERVERPETYKQWQVRNLRAGFIQLPFDQDIMKKAKEKVRTGYHKDFVIDEDSQWLLQGWKGRIVYALSCWKPI
ncbi:Scarecrow-like protein [Actinidia chinensis var. chinensis]|uniref:Scarecrow-like protein n=1 Tax=Actinidia chinensis var. chinensis TaxID=1590841 RepID=A0A2R6QKD6_ACTCC|nr:Scarecrow-like protein [Actinidia chinensis var. chinensis]